MTSVPAPATASGPLLRLAGARAVFERDFLVFTSRGRFLLVRTLVVVLPAVVMVTTVTLNSGRQHAYGSSGLGPAFYAVSAALVPSLVLLLAPVLAASSIASERSLNTLQIVLASPVSPLAFVAAKFASRLCVVLVLVLATLPLAGLCFLYGGVSFGLFLDFVAFATGVAVLGTAAGMVASSWARSVAAAAMTSYFLAIAVPVLHLCGVGIASAVRNDSRLFRDAHLLLPANPFYAWGKLGIDSFRGASADSPGATLLAWSCGAAVLALVFCAWRVGREAAHETARRGGPRAASDMWFENPVLDRGLRGTLVHRPRATSWLRLGFVLLVAGVILTLAGVSNSLESAEVHVAFLCITTLFVALATMTSASHTIAAERETGALDMLLATRLTPREVGAGKFASVLLGVAPLVLVALIYGLVAVEFTQLRLLTVAAWLAALAVVTPFFAAVGLWCSATAASAGRAVLRSYALLIGGSLVHGVAGAIFMALSHFDEADLLGYVFGPSPFYVGSVPIGLTLSDRAWEHPEYNLLLAWVLWSAVYAGATLGLVHLTVGRLARRNEAA